MVRAARASRVPTTVIGGQSRSLPSSVAVYPQVRILLVRAMIATRSSKLAMRVRFPSPAHRTYQPTRQLLSIWKGSPSQVQLLEGGCVVDEEAPGSILLLAKNNRSTKSQGVRVAVRIVLP